MPDYGISLHWQDHWMDLLDGSRLAGEQTLVVCHVEWASPQTTSTLFYGKAPCSSRQRSLVWWRAHSHWITNKHRSNPDCAASPQWWKIIHSPPSSGRAAQMAERETMCKWRIQLGKQGVMRYLISSLANFHISLKVICSFWGKENKPSIRNYVISIPHILRW